MCCNDGDIMPRTFRNGPARSTGLVLAALLAVIALVISIPFGIVVAYALNPAVRGLARSVGEDGALVVETADGPRRIVAGEVGATINAPRREPADGGPLRHAPGSGRGPTPARPTPRCAISIMSGTPARFWRCTTMLSVSGRPA